MSRHNKPAERPGRNCKICIFNRGKSSGGVFELALKGNHVQGCDFGTKTRQQTMHLPAMVGLVIKQVRHDCC